MLGAETKIVWIGPMRIDNPRRYIDTLIRTQHITRALSIKANRFHCRAVSTAMNTHMGLIRRMAF